jgi:hypothetical protein
MLAENSARRAKGRRGWRRKVATSVGLQIDTEFLKWTQALGEFSYQLK